ncbi:MAG: RNA methyltransferase [Deltaproteobacteria bacterium]|nr:RNA methyltransferase [Deltaproteobacteria bacterium]
MSSPNSQPPPGRPRRPGAGSLGRQEHKLDRRPPTRSLAHVDVVLNEPQKSENIGAAARAVANTGLGRLVVVAPRTLNRELMEATATVHALPVLENMLVARTLREAVEPHALVVGTTARAGSRRGPFLSPRLLAGELLGAGDPLPTALLFGAERMGLTTAELRLCQKIVRIPTASSRTSSLNLAQAVLILGYELLVAAGGGPAEPAQIKPAPQKSLNLMYDELEDTLVGIGFLPADNPGHWLMNVKKIFNRSQLSSGECDLLLGLCRQIRWAVKNLSDLEPTKGRPKVYAPAAKASGSEDFPPDPAPEK